MNSYLKIIFNYIQAARPKTLIICFSIWMVSLGLVIKAGEPIDSLLNFSILACMLCLQIAVNYFNDALDFKNKKDTSHRLGPVRMVQAGLISEQRMMKASFFVLSLEAVCGFYLVLKGGLFILVIGVTGMCMAYFYSAPPLSIADRGLSEIFVFLFFGLFAVMGIFYLNMTNRGWGSFDDSFIAGFFYFDPAVLKISLPAFIAGSQMGFLSMSLLLVNHLRDQLEDTQSQKRTWVVRKGRQWGLVEWSFSVILPYFMGCYWFLYEGNLLSFFLPFIACPFYVFVFLKMKDEKPSQKYNFYLALTSLGQFLFSASLLFSWLV